MNCFNHTFMLHPSNPVHYGVYKQPSHLLISDSGTQTQRWQDAVNFFKPALLTNRRAMAATLCQVMGFVLGLIGVAGIMAATRMDQWATEDLYDNIITSVYSYSGLWRSCFRQSSGLTECRPYFTILGLPGNFNMKMSYFHLKRLKHNNKAKLFTFKAAICKFGVLKVREICSNIVFYQVNLINVPYGPIFWHSPDPRLRWSSLAQLII